MSTLLRFHHKRLIDVLRKDEQVLKKIEGHLKGMTGRSAFAVYSMLVELERKNRDSEIWHHQIRQVRTSLNDLGLQDNRANVKEVVTKHIFSVVGAIKNINELVKITESNASYCELIGEYQTAKGKDLRYRNKLLADSQAFIELTDQLVENLIKEPPSDDPTHDRAIKNAMGIIDERAVNCELFEKLQNLVMEHDHPTAHQLAMYISWGNVFQKRRPFPRGDY